MSQEEFSAICGEACRRCCLFKFVKGHTCSKSCGTCGGSHLSIRHHHHQAAKKDSHQGRNRSAEDSRGAGNGGKRAKQGSAAANLAQITSKLKSVAASLPPAQSHAPQPAPSAAVPAATPQAAPAQAAQSLDRATVDNLLSLVGGLRGPSPKKKKTRRGGKKNKNNNSNKNAGQ